MPLVSILQKFFLNFQLNFSITLEGHLLNRIYVYLLAFKRLVNKNFNQMIFLFREIIRRFFLVKALVCSAMFQKTFTRVLNSPKGFSHQTSFPKSI